MGRVWGYQPQTATAHQTHHAGEFLTPAIVLVFFRLSRHDVGQNRDRGVGSVVLLHHQCTRQQFPQDCDDGTQPRC